MGAFKLFAIISSGLLSCSGAVALVGWQEIYYQPTGNLIRVHPNNWALVIKAANDKVLNLKVETGIISAPAS